MRRHIILLLLLAAVGLTARGQGVGYRYWVDAQQEQAVTGSATAAWHHDLDVSALSNGIHTLYYVLTDASGVATSLRSVAFWKRDMSDYGSTYRYWIDNDTEHAQEGEAADVIHLDLDVTGLSNGFHTFYLVLNNAEGDASSLGSGLFWKLDTGDVWAHYRYWVDDDTASAHEGEATSVQHLDIDVNGLSEGFHTLYLVLSDNTGAITCQRSALFLRMPTGHGIVRYEYFVNDLTEAVGGATLSEPQAPLVLVADIDVPTRPLRSQCFHFELDEQGEPVVMAKNDLVFRFFDDEARYTQATAQYADPNTAEPVAAELLTSGETRQSAAPAENAINWYKAEVQAGDSLVFTATGGGTMNLFAPDGRALAETAEGGLYVRATEGGTYYLAVHDVSDGSQWVNVYFERIADESAISGIAADRPAVTRVYDLQGRPVAQPHGNIYIVDGRKLVVK